MKERRNRERVSPIDKTIQANKDEAESMLRVWGKKERKHILPDNKQPK